MSEVEDKVIEVLSGLLEEAVWDAPSGGTVPLVFHKGFAPEKTVADSPGIDEPAENHMDPFVVVRYIGVTGSRIQKNDRVLIYGQLWQADAGSEIYRLGGLLEKVLEEDPVKLLPWGLRDEIKIDYGDEYGNQAAPIHIVRVELKFYRG